MRQVCENGVEPATAQRLPEISNMEFSLVTMTEVSEQTPAGKGGIFFDVHTADMARTKLRSGGKHDPTSGPKFQNLLPANELRVALDRVDQGGCVLTGAKGRHGWGGRSAAEAVWCQKQSTSPLARALGALRAKGGSPGCGASGWLRSPA